MAPYRSRLPQLTGDVFLTDGGLETTLIFHDGLELPDFAAFGLVATEDGRAALRHYILPYLDLARTYNVGFILDSPTWRANADWGTRLGYSAEEVDELNRMAIAQVAQLRDEYATGQTPIVINGCIGPCGDGYVPGALMTAEEAQAYHTPQITTFSQTDADMVTALTLNYVDEAIGIARAARAAAMPVVLSFTVETDGKLPTGQSLEEAIMAVDAATESAPAYYMVNCAHPTHFADVLVANAPWTQRIRGVRANASRMSHAELNESPELDEGDPATFGAEHRDLRERVKTLSIFGGCCGTDHRHVEQICKACLA